MKENRYLKDFSKIKWNEKFNTLLFGFGRFFHALYNGFKTRSIPHFWCLPVGIILCSLILLRWDYYAFEWAGIPSLWPKGFWYFVYYYLCFISGYWLWAFIMALRQMQLSRKTQQIFQECGLKNNLGKVPQFMSDRALDKVTRKLTVTRSTLSMDQFDKSESALRGALRSEIDVIEENLEGGTVEITYSSTRLDPFWAYPTDKIRELKPTEFFVGKSRTRALTANLTSTPHLLIAGETGAGKSTFLKGFITSTYLNNPAAQFSLIDLKKGLELEMFGTLPGVEVISSMHTAVDHLATISKSLEPRLTTLKANNCKNITDYLSIPEKDRIIPTKVSSELPLVRHFIVVDEAAELALAGQHASPSQIKIAKESLSQIARLGRSAGVHLVICTQRPDSRALDPQIKANLPGVLCFRMVNDASSINVLGVGRATDLPRIDGRAIWKVGGMEMTEVQTPYLEDHKAEKLLKEHIKSKQNKSTTSPTTKEQQ